MPSGDPGRAVRSSGPTAEETMRQFYKEEYGGLVNIGKDESSSLSAAEQRDKRVLAAAEKIRAMGPKRDGGGSSGSSIARGGSVASRSASPASRSLVDRVMGREPVPAVRVDTDPTDVEVDFVSVLGRGGDIGEGLDLSESMTAEVASAVQAMYIADAEGDPRGAEERG